jgi:STE24 endopeptidase
MAGFDAQAAAAAFLAQLPPGALEQARLHAREAHWSSAAGGALAILLCWLILRTRILEQLKAWIERDRPRPWLASLVCAAAGLLCFAILIAPWDALIAWRQSLAPGAAEFDLKDFVIGTFGAELGPLALLAVLLALLYALVRTSPRRWWLWAGGLFGALAFAAVWLPYVLASGPAGLSPLPPGPARTAVMQVVQAARLPARNVYLEPGPAIDADVTGSPWAARVVITRGMLEQASPAEIRAGVGHLAGHFHYGDELSLALVLGLLVLGGFFASHRLFGPAARLMGARPGRTESDPASLPVMAAVTLVWIGASGVVFNTFDRLVNVRADQYSLDHAREPDGLALSLVRAWRDDDVDPPRLDEILFYDHPPLKSRVLHAMTWKARRAP